MNVKQLHCVIALGANLESRFGDPKATILAAFAAIRAEEFTTVRESALFSTPAYPEGWGPDYVNAAGAYTTLLSPVEILERLHRIEAHFGRKRQQRWGSRILDLDLVAVDDLVLPDLTTWTEWAELPASAQTARVPDELVLPHPRLADRAFVLVPMQDVAPDWIHPVGGATVSEMCAALPTKDVSAISRL